MKRIMAVYDLDLFYAKRFADVMNQKENIPFGHADIFLDTHTYTPSII